MVLSVVRFFRRKESIEVGFEVRWLRFYKILVVCVFLLGGIFLSWGLRKFVKEVGGREVFFLEV